MTRHPDATTAPASRSRGDVADPASLAAAHGGRRRGLLPGALAGRRRLRAQGRRRRRGRSARPPTRPAWSGSSTSAVSAARIRTCRPTCGPAARWSGCWPAGTVPVTVLRAAIVIGHGGISWEITRQLVDHLPAMVVPHWVTTKTQPIALRDVVRYLVGVLEPAEARGRTFEVGGPEVLTYAEMMQRVARIHHQRHSLPMLAVPLLTPRLSSHWLSLVTDVDTATARNLVDSMSNEVVVERRLDPRAGAGPADGLRRRGTARRSPAARRRPTAAEMTDQPEPRPRRGRRARLIGRAVGRGPAGADRQGRARPPAVRRGVPPPPDRRRRHAGGRRDAARPLLLHRAGRSGVLSADLRAGRDLGARQLRVRAAASGPHHRSAATCAGRSSPRSWSGCCWPRSSPSAALIIRMIPAAGQPDRGRARLRPGEQSGPGLRDHPGRTASPRSCSSAARCSPRSASGIRC